MKKELRSEATDDDNNRMETDGEEEEEAPQLGPAALGLHRVGEPPVKPPPQQPTQVLNARGMPARIRKKNKFFFDEDMVNTPHHRVKQEKKPKTPIKKPRLTPVKKEVQQRTPRRTVRTPKRYAASPPLPSPDRKVGQKIGMRLRNLLKLPKAHKWVCYEWFYSNIDMCLFGGENDFKICLKESFPDLKTTMLTRVEWTKIRRLMGRPRRCSQAFFDQERHELEKKRNKIRAIQQRKAADMASFQDLPQEIPMQLVIGTKVTARLRKPQDGLFTGTIGGVDVSNDTYRITFERPGLGIHSVPDYEVLANEVVETINLNNLFKSRRNGHLASYQQSMMKTYHNPLKRRDPMMSSTMMSHSPLVRPGPTRALLEKIILVRKILAAKRVKIKLMKSMNSEAEKFNSYDEEIPEDFERRYAGILIDLEKINDDLQTTLAEMQRHYSFLAPDPSILAMLTPSLVREKCREEATEIVQRNNSEDSGERPVRNAEILELITDLTGLMLQVKCLSDSDDNGHQLQVLDGTMEQIKRKLSHENQSFFLTNIQVHMRHLQFGLAEIPKKM